MIDFTVSSVMIQRTPTVDPETPLVDAARLLRDPDVPALVACDDHDAVVGIVSESDVVAVVAERGGNRQVGTFMSTPVETTTPTTPLNVAAHRMREAGVTTLPVVDDDTYRGLVTEAQLAPYLSRNALDVEWTGDPLTIEESDTTDALATE